MQTYLVTKDFPHAGRVKRVGDEIDLSPRQARSLRIAGFIGLKPDATEVPLMDEAESTAAVAAVPELAAESEPAPESAVEEKPAVVEPPKFGKRNRHKYD